jgi:hypothetical protein
MRDSFPYLLAIHFIVLAVAAWSHREQRTLSELHWRDRVVMVIGLAFWEVTFSFALLMLLKDMVADSIRRERLAAAAKPAVEGLTSMQFAIRYLGFCAGLIALALLSVRR